MRDHSQDQDGSPPDLADEANFLRPGHNVWRVERAERAAVLVDGANYFGAAREAMLAARRSIHIVGWDLDSRMRLVGPSGTCDDGLPETLVAFLSALTKRRPQLRIRLLLWDYSVVFSLERELMPIVTFLWGTPRQIEICLDDVLPLGASHHQKMVVVDDEVAFSGGLDLTRRRWDTSEHLPDNPQRIDPAGESYAPFHDVQMLVDGDAARALGELVRLRWQRATGERLLMPPAATADDPDPWPASVEPDLRAVEIGIARTQPHYGEEPHVGEIELLFGDMVRTAQHYIYIENQFLTHAGTAALLAQRLGERPELEAVIVVPTSYPSWFEQQTMLGGRLRFMRILEQAGCGDRVRLVYPEVGGGADATPVMVHSKVMIVDDRILRVGSANLCNRSMGLDTECDLVVVAQDQATREGIAMVRGRLLGEHIGVAAPELAGQSEASLIARIDAAGDGPRKLLKVADGESGIDISGTIEAIADPNEPLYRDPVIGHPGNRRGRLPLWAKIGLGLVVLLLLGFAWQNSPLAEPEKITQAMQGIADRPWAPPAVILLFVVAGAVAFPVTLLMVSTIAVFDGWTGAALAGAGAMSSAIATYGIGRGLGTGMLRRFIGPRINRIRRSLSRQGVLAIASVRLVPVAPFTFVNLVAGAIQLRFMDYLIGTSLGLLPGLIVMSALGHQIVALIADPSMGSIAILVGFILLWLAISIGIQFLIRRYRKPA